MTATQQESFTSGERLQNLRTAICEKSVGHFFSATNKRNFLSVVKVVVVQTQIVIHRESFNSTSL